MCIQRAIYALQQLHIFAQLRCIARAYLFIQQRIIQVVYRYGILFCRFLAGGKEVQAAVVQVVHAFKFLAHVDRPGKRVQAQLQLLFYFIHQVERVLAIAVHLVHKHNHGRIAHTAYLYQLAGLVFHTVHAVYHQYYTVHRSEGAVRILGKIFVTGRIQQVDEGIVVFKAHYGCGHRDTPLALYFHKVARSMFLYLVALHSPCHLYSATKQQQFLGKRGLTRIRVRYNGKSSPLRYFFFVFHCFSK